MLSLNLHRVILLVPLHFRLLVPVQRSSDSSLFLHYDVVLLSILLDNHVFEKLPIFLILHPLVLQLVKILVFLVSDVFHPTHFELLSLLSDFGLLFSLFLNLLLFPFSLLQSLFKLLFVSLFQPHDLLCSLSSVLNLLHELILLVLKHLNSVVQ